MARGRRGFRGFIHGGTEADRHGWCDSFGLGLKGTILGAVCTFSRLLLRVLRAYALRTPELDIAPNGALITTLVQ